MSTPSETEDPTVDYSLYLKMGRMSLEPVNLLPEADGHRRVRYRISSRTFKIRKSKEDLVLRLFDCKLLHALSNNLPRTYWTCNDHKDELLFYAVTDMYDVARDALLGLNRQSCAIAEILYPVQVENEDDRRHTPITVGMTRDEADACELPYDPSLAYTAERTPPTHA